MPQGLIQKNGAKVWGGEYRAFGELTAETGSWENRLRFPGQYFDQETGNYYNYFRDYDPATGRYLQSDPIGLDGGLNTYAYVEGKPFKYIDPYGLKECEEEEKCPYKGRYRVCCNGWDSDGFGIVNWASHKICKWKVDKACRYGDQAVCCKADFSDCSGGGDPRDPFEQAKHSNCYMKYMKCMAGAGF
jgi:RHS repeat-associated protein